MANTYGLTFSWGFGGVATSLMILVSGLANLLIRIVLPMVGLLALMTSDAQLPEGANGVVESTLLVLVLVAILVFLMLVSSTVAGWLVLWPTSCGDGRQIDSPTTTGSRGSKPRRTTYAARCGRDLANRLVPHCIWNGGLLRQ